MLFIQKIVDLLKTPLFGGKSAPTLPQAIEKAQSQLYDAQAELEYLDVLLSEAKEEKLKALRQGQLSIESALEADKEVLEIEAKAHQEELNLLEASFLRRREALLNQLKQLAETQESTLSDARGEFKGKVQDAENRAKAAQRELDRIKSQLKGPEQ